MYNNKREVIPYLLPAILLVGIFIYFAVSMNIYYSFFRWNTFSRDMTWIGFGNFTRLYNDSVFWISFVNTFRFVFWSLIFQVSFSLVLAAILEERWLRKFGGFCRTIYFIPSVLSMTIVALLWQLAFNGSIGFVNEIFRKVGLGSLTMDWLGNSKSAIYCVIFINQWQYVGYTMMLFIVAIQKVPEDYFEVAMIDGANAYQRFVHITLPNVKEMVALVTTTTLIGSFRTFEQVLALTTGGPGRASEVLGTMLYREGFRNDQMGYASAIAVVIFVITMIFSISQIRLYNISSIEGSRL